MIRLGQRGAPVIELQRLANVLLRFRGDKTLTEDGIFGRQTQGAVIDLLLQGGLELSDNEEVTDEALQVLRQMIADLPQPDDLVAGAGVLLDGVRHAAPPGLRVVQMPCNLDHTNARSRPVTHLLLHRGAERRRKSETYAEATLRALAAQQYSTTFTLDVDGTIAQHFDPADRRGRHAIHHNVQSDSIDVAGPFSRKLSPVAGQEPRDLRMAIGRATDHGRPLERRYAPVRCWSLTPAQRAALALFVPWWCGVRGIPLRACSDWRTFRVGGLGLGDAVTGVTGILAHMQVAGPGSRVDGAIELEALLGVAEEDEEAGAGGDHRPCASIA